MKPGDGCGVTCASESPVVTGDGLARRWSPGTGWETGIEDGGRGGSRAGQLAGRRVEEEIGMGCPSPMQSWWYE